jgi:hypothetical protein
MVDLNTERLQFEAVMAAKARGIPLPEAVAFITGEPDEWNGLVQRVVDSFSDLELER